MTSLHATLRDALDRRWPVVGHDVDAEVAAAAVFAWLGEDTQAETAARARWEAIRTEWHAAWDDLEPGTQARQVEEMRAALGALTHHEAGK